jgi:selenocysteine lyase/cysteine desulfurase
MLGVYLDNAATSHPKPPEVVEAVREALGHSLTVARSSHMGSFRADEVLRRCRAKMARFIGAAKPEEIIYCYSATDALNMALHGLLREGGHVIVSPLEHHSVMRVLRHFEQSRGVSFSVLPADGRGRVDPDALRGLLRPESCLLAVNMVSNVTGIVQPVAELGRLARELGLPYLVDASQATGAMPLSVEAIGCTALAQPAHKSLLSLPGLGILYLREGCELAPWRIGGTGQLSELLSQPPQRPLRYESGTPAVPGIVGLDAALDWFSRNPPEQIDRECRRVLIRLARLISEIPGLRFVGSSLSLIEDEREPLGHLLSFTLQRADGSYIDPLALGTALAEMGVSSRAGLHCAPDAHSFHGTLALGGTLRFSVGAFSTEEHADIAAQCVKAAAAEL